jgi:Protein of unknown function, DUF547
MRALGGVLLLIVMSAIAAEGEQDPWAQILAARVNESGEVAYRRLAEEDGRLFRRALERMGSVDVGGLDHAGAVAFWINAYHATVIAAVLHGEAPETLAGRARMYHWFREKVGGSRRTLDEIREILNGYASADPRIHLAVSNGARGAPRLSPTPYVPDHLDAQLAAAARRFVNDVDHNYVDSIHQRLELSRVFSWYLADFEAAGGTLVKYLRLLAERRDLVAALEPEHVEVRFLPFDWRLNATAGERIR